jgi:hypothetical protein
LKSQKTKAIKHKPKQGREAGKTEKKKKLKINYNRKISKYKTKLK